MWSQILSEFQTILAGRNSSHFEQDFEFGCKFFAVKCEVFLGMLTNNVMIDVSIEGN
jgi:hypothetical protein